MFSSREIRNQFLDFFEKRNHKIIPSAPVIPFDDPTLLFTNAGMNQFKDVFLGKGTREYKRFANTQKVIRVSGKHNDLEEVGHDTYHHTFFEMLGNWSFGDYYKPEAIQWAWELLTEVWKLPKERLWATVYNSDNESFELWKSKTDINPEHILKFGEKDNFWEMGETGPCGPCSEIHINTGPNFNNPSYVNAGKPECIEIWNLVFIQYDRDEDGNLSDLPQKHVDTGMGFERICAVLQNKSSNYDTDIFTPLIEKISEISGKKYQDEKEKIPMRVIADHIRTLTFAIADGAAPGNEGRGYVLRRILRRAARYGRKLNLKEPFLFKLVDVLVSTMGDIFPEIDTKKEHVKKIIKAEEESFNATLDRGIELFDQVIKEMESSKKKNIPGVVVFKLYDTYGFPVDLTNIMAQEKGFTIDEAGFNKSMEAQKQKAREAAREKLASVNIGGINLKSFELSEDENSEFTGYNELRSESRIIGHKKENDNELIILDKTPFYVEAGGQIDDHGKILTDRDQLDVIDVMKIDDKIVHVAKTDSVFSLGEEVIAQVDEKRRWDIMRNHTGTHFLHSALRNILGTHVHQAGSYVGPDRLRFDFTHYSKLSEAEIRDIESLVNGEIRNNIPLIHHKDIPFDEAKKMGALMFFGDKYGEKVNVVQFGDFSMEFCGGTHVGNSSEIGLFKIINESSIASGVRRIEAVTGAGIEKYIKYNLDQLKSSEEKIAELNEAKRKLEKELNELKFKDKVGQVDEILLNPSEIKGIKIFKGIVNASSMDELKSFGDELRNKMKSGVGALFSEIDNKASIVSVVSDDLIKEKNLSAGSIVGELAKIVGGGGGGRAHLATAGGKDVSKIPDALQKTENIVAKFL
ncbi:MAG TPA: alanine--tRNA ligase [Ignavibacteriaceae bacterium]|nr:alanine--tRNA ligase [Ignavibacteriaceae bacterium]